MEFEPIIGLEVHAQLKTKTKIFCGCSTGFGAEPNAHTCPVCLGMPGVLPVLNKKVVEYTLKMALATGCRIELLSRFARKNYFYPDLPKGYQISQYEQPIAQNGEIEIEVGGEKQKIGITRIHMEEDAGKLNHDPDRPVSRVDLNRTGVPLIEIVSEPELKSPEAAGAYLRQLRSIVRTLDICDGNLEEGSFRCDANVSVRPSGTETFGTRTELKNLNSFRHVERAIQYEINRQIDILKDNGMVVQETRLWNEGKKKTHSMRGKEDAHDYRYFPDPDLLPLEIDSQWIDSIKTSLPELPKARKARFMDQYDLTAGDAEFLSIDRDLSDYFESCVKIHSHAKRVGNWIMGPVLGMLNAGNMEIKDSPVSHEDLAGLLDLIENKTISEKIAKTVFEEMVKTGKTPDIIIKDQGLSQISDESELEKIVQNILERSPDEVRNYLGGKTKLMGFFVGQVMKATKGQANPRVTNQILKKMLDLHKINE